jgi:tetratricopeptide (TPR) repeat protein
VDEKLTARAKLIYERDGDSPLFLRAADFYLRNNDPQTAYSILGNGLKIFPEHPLAHILMGKVHYALGNIEESELFLRKGCELLNSEQTFTYYKNKFHLPDKKSSPFDSSRGNIFMNSQEDFIFDEEVTNTKSSLIEDNLNELAEKLINARIDRSGVNPVSENNQKEYNPDRSKLATETLANIYLSQGQKSEAIKVYELLADRNPEKKEYYLKKIRDLKFQ